MLLSFSELSMDPPFLQSSRIHSLSSPTRSYISAIPSRWCHVPGTHHNHLGSSASALHLLPAWKAILPPFVCDIFDIFSGKILWIYKSASLHSPQHFGSHFHYITHHRSPHCILVIPPSPEWRFLRGKEDFFIHLFSSLTSNMAPCT